MPILTLSPESSSVPALTLQTGDSVDSIDQLIPQPHIYPQPVLKPEVPVAVAAIPDEIDTPEFKQPHNVSVWGTIETEFGSVSHYSRIILLSLSRNKSYNTFSDFHGHFEINGIAPAKDYLMRVVPHGMFQLQLHDNVDLTADHTALSIVLEALPVGTLTGEIVNSDGAGISGLGIKITTPNKPQWAETIITDSAGRFEVKKVPIGALEFTSTFGQPLLITGHDFTGDQQYPLVLVVDHGPNDLNGLVYDQFNNLVPGINVMLGWESTEGGMHSVVNRRSTTDPFGQFSMKGIGSGEHDLLLTDSAGSVYSQTVDIGNNNTELTIILSQPPLTY
jgi:hypothetical protein